MLQHSHFSCVAEENSGNEESLAARELLKNNDGGAAVNREGERVRVTVDNALTVGSSSLGAIGHAQRLLRPGALVK